MGEVVCTGLHNRLQPLIRYQIGDVARWAVNQNCPCGRQMPILEAVDGRSEDMCYTSDGRAMLRFDTVFKGVKNIREAQVIQEALGFFVIKVVAESGFGPAEIKRLEQNMMLHVGPVKVAIEIVTAIPRTLSGKFRAVISTLSNVNTQ
jgi:phenylacetate-CoA ligase